MDKDTNDDTASQMSEVQPEEMEETGKSHTPKQEDVESPKQEDMEKNMHHQVPYCKEGTENGSISPTNDMSPDNTLIVQFKCLQTEDNIQEPTCPPQEHTQNFEESPSPFDDRLQETTCKQIAKILQEMPQTPAQELECWDEYILPNANVPQDETSSSPLVFVPFLPDNPEQHLMRQHDAQSSWHFPTGRGLTEVQCPLMHFPAMSYYPPEEPTVPFNVIWRVWENLDEISAPENPDLISPPHKKAPVEFTVMSYNILAQDLLEANQELYTHCPLEVLDWSFRYSLLLEEIQTWLPDILCLQEVQEDHYHEQLYPALSQLGYTCVYKRRTGTKTDGCMTGYRSTCFSEVAVTHLEFFRPETELLDRHNVGIILLLRPLISHGSETKEEGPPLCVANTHLLFNPRRGDVKVAQLAIMLAEIDTIIKSYKAKGEHCNVILCGDFNSVPHMSLYQLITTGKLHYEGLPSWMISGQEDLSHKAHCHRLLSPLLPSCLGINDNCQYTSVNKIFDSQKSGECCYSHDFMLQLRFCPAACVRPQELILIQGVTDITPSDTEASKGSLPNDQRFGHKLSHRLNLESVYKHILPGSGRSEVTTLHSEVGQTVDYIFYTPRICDKKAVGRLAREGLKLIGCLSLLSEDVLWSMHGLPNHIFPSDHLSLMAKFQLDVNTA